MTNPLIYLLFSFALILTFPARTMDWFIEVPNWGTELKVLNHVDRAEIQSDRDLKEWYKTSYRLLALAEDDETPPPPLHPEIVFQELLAKQSEPINWDLIRRAQVEESGRHYVVNPKAIAQWSTQMNGNIFPQGEPDAINPTALEVGPQTAQKENISTNHKTFQHKLLNHKIIFSTLASVFESRLAPDSSFIRYVSGLNYGENPHSEWHSFYIKNLIGGILGLSWKPKVGPNGGEVCPLLLRNSIEDSVEIFYRLVDFEEIITTVVFRLNDVILPIERHKFTTLSTDIMITSTEIGGPLEVAQKMKKILNSVPKTIPRAEVIHLLAEMGILQTTTNDMKNE